MILDWFVSGIYWGAVVAASVGIVLYTCVVAAGHLRRLRARRYPYRAMCQAFGSTEAPAVKRSAPIRRTGFATTGRPIARTTTPQPRQRPLRAVSAKRRAKGPARAEVRRAVFARDGGCVLLGLDPGHDCHGTGLTVHHLRKASAGGAYSADNLVTLCAFGNGAVEDRPAWATALGLVRR